MYSYICIVANYILIYLKSYENRNISWSEIIDYAGVEKRIFWDIRLSTHLM